MAIPPAKLQPSSPWRSEGPYALTASYVARPRVMQRPFLTSDVFRETSDQSLRRPATRMNHSPADELTPGYIHRSSLVP